MYSSNVHCLDDFHTFHSISGEEEALQNHFPPELGCLVLQYTSPVAVSMYLCPAQTGFSLCTFLDGERWCYSWWPNEHKRCPREFIKWLHKMFPFCMTFT